MGFDYNNANIYAVRFELDGLAIKFYNYSRLNLAIRMKVCTSLSHLTCERYNSFRSLGDSNGVFISTTCLTPS